MSLTREFDLHLWTLAMCAVLQECGGLAAHHEAVAVARWNAGATEAHFGPMPAPRHAIGDGGGTNEVAAA